MILSVVARGAMFPFIQIFLAVNALKTRLKTHSHIIKSVGALTSGNFFGTLLGAIGGILVARFVSPEVNGQYRLYTIPLMYLTFLHLGTFEGLSRNIPFFIGLDRKDHVEKIASAAGAWNFFVTCAIAAVFLFCTFLGLLKGNQFDVAGWLSQSLTCVGIFYGGYLGATYRTLNNFVVLARIQLIQATVTFCLVFAVALWGFYGLCLRAAIPTLLGVWLFHRARPLRISLRFNLSAFKEVITVGMPLCFWGTLNTTLWMAVEYSLMFKLGGVKWVGIFAIASIIRESVSFLPQSVNQVLTPRIVEIYARKENAHEVSVRSFKVAGMLAVFMMPTILVISFLLDYCVPLFIPKYIDGLILMKVCLWFSFVQALALPVSTLFASGNSWLYGRCILYGFVIFISATFLLAPVLGGFLSVIVGSLIGRVARIIVAYYDVLKFIKKCSC